MSRVKATSSKDPQHWYSVDSSSVHSDSALPPRRVISDYADYADGKISQPSAVSKVSIPPHLLGNAKSMRGKKSNKPVGGSKGKFRQPGWRNINAGHVADYGMKAWQLAKHIATLINVEEKVWDVDGSSGTTITSTPTVVNLSNIAQGSDFYNRIGDSILVQKLEFRAYAEGNGLTNGNVLRVLIVSDRLQSGTDPSLGDVLQAGTLPYLQPYQEPKDGRFTVIYDELVALPSYGAGLATSGTSTAFTVGREVMPVMDRKWNKHIKYQGATGADASNWLGGLYLMAVSGDAANGPTLRYTFRVRYTDN